jgi:carboxyl-terminal processing protease
MNRRHLVRSAAAGLALLGLGAAAPVDYFEVTKQIELFNAVFREITLSYVDPTQPGTLMENALDGMLSELDPYTVFIPERRIEDFRIQQTGQYGGIGATIRIVEDVVLLAAVHEGGPADKAGLHPGDLLVEAGGVALSTKTMEEIGDVLKGSPGSKIDVVYEHLGERKTVSLTRAEIKMKAVPYSGLLDAKTGYIALSSFTETSANEVRTALQDLQKQGAEALVLDLRSNPGGLLTAAIEIVNLFVPKGTVVVRTKGQMTETDQVFKTLREPIAPEMSVAVLIDGQSASASEIVAGALQDLDRGAVVGQRSYGKGLVQQTRPLAYGAQLKLTVSKYYTPSGRCIQAFDYSDNARGKRLDATKRTEFRTANGRKVFDGGGVDPDVLAGNGEVSPVLYSLVRNGALFDFARTYVAKNAAPQQIELFRLKPNDYSQFLTYLEQSKPDWTSDLDEVLNDFEEFTREDGYEAALKPSVEQVRKALLAARKEQLQAHKAQISSALEIEIIGLYGYERSQAAYSALASEEVLQARELLRNKERLQQILSTPKG